MMRSMKLGLLAVAMLATTARKTQADPIIDFSFTNDPGLGFIAGTVTGQIFGLVDGQSGQSATSVIIDSAPAALPGFDALLPTDATTWSTQIHNTWTVTPAGQLTNVNFNAIYIGTVQYQIQLSSSVGFLEDQTRGASDLYTEGPIAYTAVSTPEPATITMLVSGIFAAGGFHFVRGRRRATGQNKAT
jgi:hypothetical protein